MRVAVVIATHEIFPRLESCLQSFVSSFSEANDLIFVDNGSTANIKEWVARKYPQVTTVRLLMNRLFCGGYNAGIRVAIERGCDFVLIVNADTKVVNPGFLNELLQISERWPRAAFIGPLVYFHSPHIVQRTCLQFPGIIRNAAIWLPWRLFPDHFQRQPRKETIVEVLNGVCVLCRVEALRELGLMDENMGGYAEDYDWSWRARGKGWVSVFAPVPSVIHHENPIGYEPYSLKTFLEKRNTVYWYLKFRMPASAQCYALASLFLAKNRLLLSKTSEKQRKHRYFFRRLQRAFRGLLRREPLGEWFGPPLGSWVNDHGL